MYSGSLDIPEDKIMMSLNVINIILVLTLALHGQVDAVPSEPDAYHGSSYMYGVSTTDENNYNKYLMKQSNHLLQSLINNPQDVEILKAIAKQMTGTVQTYFEKETNMGGMPAKLRYFFPVLINGLLDWVIQQANQYDKFVTYDVNISNIQDIDILQQFYAEDTIETINLLSPLPPGMDNHQLVEISCPRILHKPMTFELPIQMINRLKEELSADEEKELFYVYRIQSFGCSHPEVFNFQIIRALVTIQDVKKEFKRSFIIDQTYMGNARIIFEDIKRVHRIRLQNRFIEEYGILDLVKSPPAPELSAEPHVPERVANVGE